MKTPEEIKKALEVCQDGNLCMYCPYRMNHDGKCFGAMLRDALAKINQLEEAVSLMKIQMEGDCGCCKHQHDKGPCADCMGNPLRPHWEYEGLPELPKKGES